MAYVVFKNDITLNGELHFKSGKRYEIIGEKDDEYFVSYMKKIKTNVV